MKINNIPSTSYISKYVTGAIKKRKNQLWCPPSSGITRCVNSPCHLCPSPLLHKKLSTFTLVDEHSSQSVCLLTKDRDKQESPMIPTGDQRIRNTELLWQATKNLASLWQDSSVLEVHQLGKGTGKTELWEDGDIRHRNVQEIFIRMVGCSTYHSKNRIKFWRVWT